MNQWRERQEYLPWSLKNETPRPQLWELGLQNKEKYDKLNEFETRVDFVNSIYDITFYWKHAYNI